MLSKLLSAKKVHPTVNGAYYFDNVQCSENSLINKSQENLFSNFNEVAQSNNAFYGLYTFVENEAQGIMLIVALDIANAEMLNSTNASSYRDLSFTIPLE